MPEDKVTQRFEVTGAKEGARDVDQLAGSIEHVGATSKVASTEIGSTEEGMTALAGAAGIVSPRLGWLISLLNTTKIAALGATGTLKTMGLAIKSVFAALLTPIGRIG